MKVTIDKAMTAAVIAEFEAENPDKSHYEMSSAEFADRMMKKIKIAPEAHKLGCICAACDQDGRYE